jgi:glycerol-3-phosphate dehydrogenase
MGGNILTFLIPLFREYLAMGTTDTDYPVRGYDDLDCVPVDPQDVCYNLDILAKLFPGIFTEKDIVACYAGVRPLIKPKAEAGKQVSESDTSRTHRIWQTPSGIWAIAGGKYTTFRLMAEQMVDHVAGHLHNRKRIGELRPCTTATQRCHGAPALEGRAGESRSWISRKAADVQERSGLPEDCCLHLCESYGTAVEQVLELVQQDPELGKRLGEGRAPILAEIRYAVESEMCCSLQDFLIRRTPLRFMENQGLDVAEPVADRMGEILGWSDPVKQGQVEEYRRYIEAVWTP